MTLNVLWMGVGLVLLYFGAEFLVGGATRLAIRLGVTPLVAGLTVAAYGTSSPEAVVSVKAAMSGQGALAVGNVVGSNIVNIMVILGIAGLICPVKAESRILRREIPLMLVVTLAGMLILADRRVDAWEGWALLAGLVAYTWANVREARRPKADPLAGECDAQWSPGQRSMPRNAALIVAGLVLLVIGGDRFVEGSVGLARRFGLSEAVIGLTLVAIGTSLPELATTLVAAVRGQQDLALGNIVGSNVFNLVGILGITGMVRPVADTGVSTVDFAMLGGSAAALALLIWTGSRLNRWEAGGLLVSYGVYAAYLLGTGRVA